MPWNYNTRKQHWNLIPRYLFHSDSDEDNYNELPLESPLSLTQAPPLPDILLEIATPSNTYCPPPDNESSTNPQPKSAITHENRPADEIDTAKAPELRRSTRIHVRHQPDFYGNCT
jgi:hypothetical protein